jgi:hypothetical protein
MRQKPLAGNQDLFRKQALWYASCRISSSTFTQIVGYPVTGNPADIDL